MHNTRYADIERIQGTDGVRGKSALSCDAGLKGLSPVEAFVEKGVITEEFVELYAYCWAGLAGAGIGGKRSGEFIVGRDPRDKGSLFLKAACDGIRKAGFKAVDIGILPTPAVAVYISKRGSIGGFSITASHNPRDENGVKIFTGNPAIKLLPKEEMELTKKVLAADWKKIRKNPILGDYEDGLEDARKTFVDFHIDPINLRARHDVPLRGMVFVLDAANGALSASLKEVFGALGAEELFLLNCDLGGEVSGGGMAETFAGLSSIGPEDVFSEGARFGDCAMAKRLFEEGRRLKRELIGGNLTLSGAAFDADGDRCLRVDYDPFCDQLRVFSGDEMALQIARFGLEKRAGKTGRAPIIASVESDMGAAEAANKVGLRAIFTPVGDKWLLAEAWASFFRWALELWSKSAGGERQSEAVGLAGDIERMRAQWPASAFSFVEMYEKLVRLCGGARWIDRIVGSALRQGNMPFAVASEPSGHILLFSSVKTASGLRAPAIVGSGPGTAIASFISTRRPEIDSDPRRYYRGLASPFVKGAKISYYFNYVEKRALTRDSRKWAGLKKAIHRAWGDLFPDAGPLQEVIWPQEKDMLYLEHGSGRRGPKATIFARRSGTEDAARLTLKGPRGLEKELGALGLIIYKHMALTMKRLKSGGVRSQLELLKMTEGPIEKPPEGHAGDIEAAAKACLKEKLIEKSGDRFSPTELGRWFLRSVL